MVSPISIITTVVGIIGCIIGVATFVSAQITKAKQDGAMIEKINMCLANTEEIKNDMKEKNKELDSVIDSHSQAITKLQTEVKVIFKKLNLEGV